MPPSRDIFLTILIPAHNEAGNIKPTCQAILHQFDGEGIDDYEILVVNDGSTDSTENELLELTRLSPRIRSVYHPPPNGYGYAVRYGLQFYAGRCVCIVMADLSDSPADMITYYRKLHEGYDCVFGSRFMARGLVSDYPWLKLIINRVANLFIRLLFRIKHEDITNAFKAYRREVIDGIQPLLSKHFNLTVEMPLKAVTRGYSFCRVPISWRNRVQGTSKLKIKEMGSRYLFIVLYVWLEKHLSRGDYLKK